MDSDGDEDSSTSITVLLAYPIPLIRAALRHAITATPGFVVVAETGEGAGVLALAIRYRPDLAIVSYELTAPDGIGVCAAIRQSGLPTQVLLLSEAPDQGLLLAAVEAGASGYVSSIVGVDDVMAAARQIHGGQAFVPTEMLSVLLRDLIHRRREEDLAGERFSRLSRRELEVLSLLADGLDHREIANLLFVSPNTARTHIQNLLEKLEVHSRVEAVGLALQHDLIARSAPVRSQGGHSDA